MNNKPTTSNSLPNYSGGGADAGMLREWFKKLVTFLPPLPFKHSDRNEQVRQSIIRRIVGEVLTDDERAELFGLPKGCRIREGAKIINPDKLNIGEHCWIGENAILDASGGLTIGSHTSIGLSVFVWSHSSHLTNLNMENFSGSDIIQRKETSIGSGCFIAGPSVILAGSQIGDKCLIKPFSVVEDDVPDRSIVSSTEIKKGVFTDALIEKMTKKIRPN